MRNITPEGTFEEAHPAYFSIIIPTYNRRENICKTIQSLLNQTYRNFEILVIDDGSTDNTAGAIRSFCDDRLKYFYKQNGERGAARNYGAERANGKYLNFFDSDDVSYDHHLATAERFIIDNGDPIVFALNYDIKRVDGKTIQSGPYSKNSIRRPDELLNNNFIGLNGVFIQSDTFKNYRFSDDRELAVAEDWALWLTLESNFGIKFSPIVTSTIVEHSGRSINQWDSRKILLREHRLIRYVRSDNAISAKYGKRLNLFYAKRHVFAALALSLDQNFSQALIELKKAIRSSPSIIMSREFIAALSKLMPIVSSFNKK